MKIFITMRSVKNMQIDLFNQSEFLIEAKHTTHSGGKGECLHDWYSYLEGFSSSFVKTILNTYSPEANIVLDPFAGVGTTPVNCSLIGIESYYCEINPVLRKVISVKNEVINLTSGSKLNLAEKILNLANGFEHIISDFKPSEDLRARYSSCFGKSKFFDEVAFERVLIVRCLIDSLKRKDNLLGEALEVAVLSCLVTCSLLKRSGDVRYKTIKELQKGVPDFYLSVVEQLKTMADDCTNSPKAKAKIQLLCNNAKTMKTLDSIEADIVITSPPYLNGTNYFRNTKLELWFLRELKDEKSLRVFRDQVVTSGINDVTKTKCNEILPLVSNLHDEILEKAYDKRIAKMMSAYFYEMKSVLEGMMHHVKNDGFVCIDIGDSIYSNVYIPTHKILIDISKELGMVLYDEIVLRKRISKGGDPLSQFLLVFKNKNNCLIKNDEQAETDLVKKWSNFKNNLPHIEHPFSKRNWGSDLHSVCSYQGKMKPSLAHHLVRTFSNEGDIVLDPFSGSGTIPFEASINGRRGLGMDIGLLATSLSNAKILRHDFVSVNRIITDLESYMKENIPSKKSIEDSNNVSFNKSISDYFHVDTFREILLARDFFLKYHQAEYKDWTLVFSCMLHILHGNRPYALSRNSHPITPYAPTGDFIYKNLIEKLRNKVDKSISSQNELTLTDSKCFLADILKEWPEQIQNVNSIITSPPFFDSTKFYMTNWMRYWFCGWGIEDFSENPKSFIEVQQKKSFDVYDFIFKQSYERLVNRGIAVFHLGHSDKCNMAESLLPYAKKYFHIEDIFTESVESCEKHGIKDKGGVKEHQYLFLIKYDK